MTSRRTRFSLRLRISIVALAVVVCALVSAGFVIVHVVEHAMTSQIDRALRADADYAMRSFDNGGGVPPSGGPNGLYVQVLNRKTMTAFGLSPATKSLKPLLVDGQASGQIRSVKSNTLGPVRSLVVATPTPNVSLILARSSRNVSAVGATLTRLIVVLTLAGSVLLTAVIWKVVGGALEPVERMRRSVQGLSDTDLATRVAMPGTGDELDRLATTLNELLERLEVAIASERRFVADASHDLRTPIAALRAVLEAETANPDIAMFTRSDALTRIDELQRLVDQLLQLASADHDANGELVPVDLDDLVLTAAGQLATTSKLFIDTSHVSGGQVAGRESELARMITNLAANAARYAHTTISFRVQTFGDTVEVVIDDDGDGIPLVDRTRIFERFATLDDARAKDRSGTGLGLAIVAAIVASHHGTVRAGEAPGGGARFEVRLPTYLAEMPITQAHAASTT